MDDRKYCWILKHLWVKSDAPLPKNPESLTACAANRYETRQNTESIWKCFSVTASILASFSGGRLCIFGVFGCFAVGCVAAFISWHIHSKVTGTGSSEGWRGRCDGVRLPWLPLFLRLHHPTDAPLLPLTPLQNFKDNLHSEMCLSCGSSGCLTLTRCEFVTKRWELDTVSPHKLEHTIVYDLCYVSPVSDLILLRNLHHSIHTSDRSAFWVSYTHYVLSYIPYSHLHLFSLHSLLTVIRRQSRREMTFTSAVET